MVKGGIRNFHELRIIFMLTSIQLATIPFLGSTDSTRLQMSSKQIQQSITSLNCEIPFTITNEFNNITMNAKLGILVAEDDGQVIFNDSNIIIIYYENLDRIVTKKLPKIKKTINNYSSILRNALPAKTNFQKGDIIYEYDCFNNGIYSFGYNVNTAFMPFFGYNHEDAIVISESFAKKSLVNYIEYIYIPIFEHTILQKLYKDLKGSLIYFPNIGQNIKENIVCCDVIPRSDKITMTKILKKLNISDLVNITNNSPLLALHRNQTKIKNGTINGYRIHKIKKDFKLLDKELQVCLDKMYINYCNFIINTYDNLNNYLPLDYTKKILKEHYIYNEKIKERGNVETKDMIYLVEFEVISSDCSHIGDKFTNRYAGKGVISLIIPDEIRPLMLKNKTPIDLITNTFGVFSRMNLGQIIELTVNKNIQYCNKLIQIKPEKTIECLTWLNENIIKNLNYNKYYNSVKNHIETLNNDKYYLEAFIENVNNSNLFIECPQFSKINLHNILKNGVNPNEDILIKKELLEFMEDKLKEPFPFKKKDIVLPNVFCGPMYIIKLNKITKQITTARDLGNIKGMTKQPLRGRLRGGGSQVGQMELEGIICSGCVNSIQELITVKSDWNEGKKDLIKQIIVNGEYEFPKDINIKSSTKSIINTIIKFLKN